jgi:hypothetical protein
MKPACFLVLFALLISCGCSGSKEKSYNYVANKVATPGIADESTSEKKSPEAKDKVSARDWGKREEAPADPSPPTPPKTTDSREAKMETPAVGGVSTKAGKERGPRGGTLTAGSFDDNRDPMPYRSFFRQIGQDGSLRDLPSRFLGHRLIVTVKDDAGQPVNNARVSIAGDGGPSVELISRTDGRVVFIPAWDQIPADGDFTVTVSPPGGTAPVRQTVSRTAPEATITLANFKAAVPLELDLTLVIDTTGSMGDELEYIKAEMRSIARTIHDRFPQVNQRYGLVFYRDVGDEYVTRKFDFTTSIDEVRKNLHAQSAQGGGDPPEAMERGMEDAVNLQWRTGNTARVLFLLADAPPHAQDMERTLKAVNGLRKKGVAIYPVACSGYDNPTEFIMRTSALMTGGQFLFLTDDSGVGNPHGEPHLTNYNVERLDKLIIRMISAELTGKRNTAEPNDVLRTVGRPQ